MYWWGRGRTFGDENRGATSQGRFTSQGHWHQSLSHHHPRDLFVPHFLFHVFRGPLLTLSPCLAHVPINPPHSVVTCSSAGIWGVQFSVSRYCFSSTSFWWWFLDGLYTVSFPWAKQFKSPLFRNKRLCKIIPLESLCRIRPLIILWCKREAKATCSQKVKRFNFIRDH